MPDSGLKHGDAKELKVQLGAGEDTGANNTIYDGGSYTGVLEEGASQSVQEVQEGFLEEVLLLQRL